MIQNSAPPTKIFAILFMIVAMIATASLAEFAGTDGGYDLSWCTIDGGGGTSTGGAFVLAGTIGQSDAGSMSGGGFQLHGGFWRGDAIPAPTCLPDIAPPGGDGLVNVADLLAVIGGWGACQAPCPPSCNTDVNGDCTVNVSDLLAVISGWGVCPD